MKKNFEKIANILMVSIIVIILGLAIAIDKTNSFACKCILPVCFAILIATLVVKYFAVKKNLAIEVDDEAYAVINNKKYV